MLSGASNQTVFVITPTDKEQAVDQATRIKSAINSLFEKGGLPPAKDLASDWHRFIPNERGGFTRTPMVQSFVAIEVEPRLDMTLTAIFDSLRQLVRNFGIDARFEQVPQIRIDHTDSWAPSSRDALHFGTAASAKRLINVAPLYDLNPPATGRGVNVVIVDRGLHWTKLPAGNYGGAWIRLPKGWDDLVEPPLPSPDVGRHGTMIAQTILSIAPDAKIWELRTVPAPNEVIAGLGDILTASSTMIGDLSDETTSLGIETRQWILVNPWGVFDERLEAHIPPRRRYTSSPSHPLNVYEGFIATDFLTSHDVIFSAGNGGQFAPSWRQGPTDRGPGRSILGANGHPDVLSVGAVRSDGIWLGYSSQGQARLPKGRSGSDKPDICAPSNFVDTYDHAQLRTGTSAASAIAAGVVALLRSWELQSHFTTCSPADLFKALREAASRPSGTKWINRTGAGIVDADGARQWLMSPAGPHGPRATSPTPPAPPPRSLRAAPRPGSPARRARAR